MFKKIIAWMLLITVTATVAVGGTLAYLTDRDSEANVFTTGDVKIDLNEDFNQGSELIPGVEIEKKPAITNTGKNDAWVWATVAVPAGLDTAILIDGKGADWADWTRTETEIDGKDYILYTALYNKMLAKDAETTALFEKVELDSRVDINPEGEWYMIENGQPTTTDPLWNNSNGNPVIYVSAYAIQTEGFNSVEEAYASYQTQWGDNGGENAVPPEFITTPLELKNAMYNGGNYVLGDDIHITDTKDFYYGSYVTAVMKDTVLDLNGHNITIDVEMPTVSKAPVLFYVYKEGASLTVVGDGDIVAKNDAFIFFPRSVSEGLYIYGGNYYNNDDTSGTKNDINAIVYSQTNSNIHIYGGTFNFKNVSGHCGGFNVYDNSGAEIILHEGVLLSNSDYYQGSDGNEIHLAEGCELQEVNIDGEVWYQVVKK